MRGEETALLILCAAALQTGMASYDDDDLMEDTEEAQPPQRVRSQVNAVRKQKGRGFREGMDVDDERHAGRGYESLESGSGPGPAKCAFPEPLNVRA